MPPPCGIRPVGLGQEQAAIGRGGKDAPAAGFLDDGVVIEDRIEAEQRQLEAVLPAGPAMTAAGVAAMQRQQRHDVVDEMQRPGLVEVLDVDLDLPCFTLKLNGDFGSPPGERPDKALLRDADNAGRLHAITGGASHVGDDLARPRDNKLPALMQPMQLKPRRKHIQRLAAGLGARGGQAQDNDQVEQVSHGHGFTSGR